MPTPTHLVRISLALTALTGLLMTSNCTLEADAPPPANRLPEVATVTIAPESILLTTQLPGRISAYLVAEIRPQVSGIVLRRHFNEGAFVKAGDLLYEIDPVPYETAIGRAQASLAASQAELVTAKAQLPALRSRVERFKGLVAIRAVGQQDYDDARAALDQAEANVEARKAAIEVARAGLESARVDLSYTPIKAPISGRIGISNITVGALATAYQATPLAIIQQLDPVYVDVTQSTSSLLKLRSRLERGHLKQSGSSQRKVTLILEDGTPFPLEGSLQFRDVTVDPTTGSVKLRIVFPNPRDLLLPGMFVRAVVQEGILEDALLVPQQGVSRNQKGEPYAWVVGNDEKVEERILELDRAIADRWIVSGGLKEGDRVIVEGLQKVRPGATVRAVPFETAPATSEAEETSTTPPTDPEDSDV